MAKRDGKFRQPKKLSHAQARALAFQRDDYTCQRKKADVTICGWRGKHSLTQVQSSRHLTMHHINHKSYDHRFDLDPENVALNNVITWCNECHREYHRHEYHRRKSQPEKHPE